MSERPLDAARRLAERAARDSYGRLIAYLAARSRDIAAAEDALSDAFQSALLVWPERGVPDTPEAWLLTAARRNLDHGRRRERVRADAVPTLELIADEAVETRMTPFPDERLKLLFICAHPAIDAAARTPLMLQTVLGLDAVRIASAFLASPAAMGQRLVRAKTKIRDARIAFEEPEAVDLPDRLDAVLAAIYAAYGSGWEDVVAADPRRRGLAEEAIFLGRLIAGLMPGEPEARALLALMLHCEARRRARRDDAGRFVPLDQQDARLWDEAMILEAEGHLQAAARMRRIGRFQLEAAIQSVHATRGVTGSTDWTALMTLYEGLVAFAPTIGALVGRAAATGAAIGPAAGLAQLDALPDDMARLYQPALVVRGHLLAQTGDWRASAAAYRAALALTEDPAVRAFLDARMNEITARGEQDEGKTPVGL